MLHVEKMLFEVLKKIKPSEKEIEKELEKAESIVAKIESFEGKHVKAVLGGSLARNTHLKDDRDLDIFVMFPIHLNRKDFESSGLKIGKKIFKNHKWHIAYSEHPYVRGVIDGYDIEIIPSYQISDTSHLKSSVDRSHFHTDYLLRNLSEEQKDEARLLKQFLKGINAYGAELKTASVPGYVTELLVLKYRDFFNTLKNVAKWSFQEVIDLENFYQEEDARKRFKNSSLIIVDPTDKNRNVAAALSLQQLSRFIAASRAFLENPSTKFFFPKPPKLLTLSALKQYLKKEGLIVLELAFPSKTLPDIAWGQIRRLSKSISNKLSSNDFTIYRFEEWTDEHSSIAIVLDLKSNKLEKVFKRIGPSVFNYSASSSFLESHKWPLSGPRIEGDKWVIESERKYFQAEKLIQDFVQDLKKQSKQNLRNALKKRFRILSQKQVASLYKKNKDFAYFLTLYLKGKETFLE